MDWLWLVLLGLGTGTFGVMVGTGGGLVLVPMLLLLFNMEPAVVAGTSLALVAVNSFSGSWAYKRLGLVDLRSGLLFAGAAIPGSIVAPFAVETVAGDTFRVLFGLLLVGLAIHMTVRPLLAGNPGRSRPLVPVMVTSRRIASVRGQVFQYQFNEALATSFNVLLGFVSAFFGTGGGFLRTPVLVTAFSFPVRVAVATSVFALSIHATAGAAVHATLGHVDWYPTLCDRNRADGRKPGRRSAGGKYRGILDTSSVGSPALRHGRAASCSGRCGLTFAAAVRRYAGVRRGSISSYCTS